MRLIATKPEENAIIKEMADELLEKGIYADVTYYKDGFGFTVWSVDDLSEVPEAKDWTPEERIRFMEYADRKLGGATEDGWVMLRTLAEQYISDRKAENLAYIEKNSDEFDKTKFYLDVCGSGWVRMVYYNPDSCASGQLVYDLLSDYVISEAEKTAKTEDEFWDYLYAYAKQTLTDIDTYDFIGSAKDFVEDACHLTDQNAETMQKLKEWAFKSLNK